MSFFRLNSKVRFDKKTVYFLPENELQTQNYSRSYFYPKEFSLIPNELKSLKLYINKLFTHLPTKFEQQFRTTLG
jgi:hypothetical protein